MTSGGPGGAGATAGSVGAGAGWPKVVVQWKRKTSTSERACLDIFVCIVGCVCLGILVIQESSSTCWSVFDCLNFEGGEEAFYNGCKTMK